MEQFQHIKERLYVPKEVSEKLGITPDLLRKWVEEFNVQTEWTKPDQSGHRRFTKENLELLFAIRQKIQEQNWSWDQVRSWRNGEIDVFTTHQEQSNLEKKLESLLSNQEHFQESQMQFNQALLQKLDQLTNELIDTKKQLSESQQREEQLQQYIEQRLEKRDELLLENIRQMQEQKETKKRKGIFGLFG